MRIPHPPSWSYKKDGIRNALAVLDGVVDNDEMVRWPGVVHGNDTWLGG